MKTKKTIQEIIDGAECPLNISVIPNNMGINLCSVEAIEWDTLEDGQLTNLNIIFIPKEDKDIDCPSSKGVGKAYINPEGAQRFKDMLNEVKHKSTIKSMTKTTLAYLEDSLDVRDIESGAVVFSTKLPDDLAKDLGRTYMNSHVVNNLIEIWNKTGLVYGNLFSDGAVDNYLLADDRCSQDEREIIVEALYKYWDEKSDEAWGRYKKEVLY